jgi:hypothetical protein
MNTLKFSCPHCEQHLKCDETLSGREFQCPTCNHLIHVPHVPGRTAEYKPESGVTWNTFIAPGRKPEKPGK